MITWREFFSAINTKEYHSQRENKARYTANKLESLGEVVGIGSTTKALAIDRPDFDFLLIFPEDPLVWNSEDSLATDDIITGYLDHKKFFNAIKRKLGGGNKSYPSIIYTPVASIQGGAPGKVVPIEVTPAIRIIRNNQLTQYLLIPDKRTKKSWRVTDSLMEADRLIKLNSLFPNFKNFVRFWKKLAKEKQFGLTSRQILSLMGSWTTLNINRFPEYNLDCVKSQAAFFLAALKANQYFDFSGEGAKKFPDIILIRNAINGILELILSAQNLDQVILVFSKNVTSELINEIL